mmetsp:Transcript_10668/g.15965  ORF Transcript_10668/g.15965 Transcript_10668/m.15965 type:complete len:165 (-) Transcript_10668:38-532(-)|eukprot:CAMPEP_0171457044 /NCGR_PEP_ID=MMETSP0945-20130129/3281_1 /TAXON_ID=109269 /ORGANISM="Vaucheria litorea, Strain CCMP2940" /LENGTH=164 /DNA_ID=CAMNT_0011982575 /DNA_START=57 /DNA_END=551 /DNA_ORIENTATION=-
MSCFCIGPICIPWAAFFPFLVVLFKYIYEFLLKTPLAVFLPKFNEEEAPDIPESKVVKVTSEEHWKELLKIPLLVIQFTAVWCGPCKKISPVFQSLSAIDTNVTFAKIDIDKLPDLAVENGVSTVPQFHIFEDGAFKEKMVGSSEQKLRKLVEKYSKCDLKKDN